MSDDEPIPLDARLLLQVVALRLQVKVLCSAGYLMRSRISYALMDTPCVVSHPMRCESPHALRTIIL